ncbi:MAG: DUF2461 family protein [Mangrovicoccus sp.]
MLPNEETFRFLQDLSTGRDKAWFDAERKRYETVLLEPMRALVTAVGPALAEREPDMEIRPNVNKTLSRINRDMRFVKGKSPYKDNMIAMFYREGRKRQDAQLFVGLQPSGAWSGLYVPSELLGGKGPMAQYVAQWPDKVTQAGQAAGLGTDLTLVTCKSYGEVSDQLDPARPSSYIQDPHLCFLHESTPEQIGADPEAFVASSIERLIRLIPLWKLYSGA